MVKKLRKIPRFSDARKAELRLKIFPGISKIHNFLNRMKVIKTKPIPSTTINGDV